MHNDLHRQHEQVRYATLNPQNSYLSGQIQIPLPNNVSNEYKTENSHTQNVHFPDVKQNFSPLPNVSEYSTNYP